MGTRAFRCAAALAALIAAGCGALSCASCSSQPAARVSDRLDPVTGNTVVVLAEPAELVTVGNRGGSRDPFAFAAPFDVDRMGNRELYLWVSVPGDGGAPMDLQVLCDGRPLELVEAQLDLGGLQLSRPPYAPVTPWSGEQYFRLTPAALSCLAGARSMDIEFQAQGAHGTHPEHFATDASNLRGFAAFAAHLAAP